MNETYSGHGHVLYASKAFSCKEMCRICKEEGMGLDVVSGGELYTALQAGFPADRIYMHGNNKTVEELQMALDAGISRIIVDNLTELHTLNDLALIRAKRPISCSALSPVLMRTHTALFARGRLIPNLASLWKRVKRWRACAKRSKWSAFIFAACTATSAPRFLILILSSTRPR